jgi:hypothetical protein
MEGDQVKIDRARRKESGPAVAVQADEVFVRHFWRPGNRAIFGVQIE